MIAHDVHEAVQTADSCHDYRPASPHEAVLVAGVLAAQVTSREQKNACSRCNALQTFSNKESDMGVHLQHGMTPSFALRDVDRPISITAAQIPQQRNQIDNMLNRARSSSAILVAVAAAPWVRSCKDNFVKRGSNVYIIV